MTTNQLLETGLKEIAKSETLLINEHSVQLEKQGVEVYKFGFGQSPFSPPAHIVEALQQSAICTDYLPVQGLAEARDAAATFHSEKLGIQISAEDVFIGPGSKMLMFNVMHCFKEAMVFLITPSWVSYEPQANCIGHDVIRIETTFDERWRLTAERFSKALNPYKDDKRTKILVLNYPGNPDGLGYNEQELKELAAVAKQHNVLIISDEIYGFLNFKNEHKSIAKYYPEGTIISTGLSKWCGAGGWRLGALILPHNHSPAFKTTLLGLGSETYSTATAPVQWAAVAAYTQKEETETFLTKQTQILNAIGTFVAKKLSGVGLQVHEPEGGFYVYIDFEPFRTQLEETGIKTGHQMTEKILEEAHVALLPGLAFGTKESVLTTRLAFVDFDGDKTLEVADETEQLSPEAFVEKHCPKVYKGINQLANWVTNLKEQ